MKHLCPSHRRSRQSGFSVIELLTVMVMITIMLAATIPAMQKHTGTAKLKQAAEEVANTLKLARQRAVSTNGHVVVQFDADNRNFYLFDDIDEDGTRDNGETMSGPYEMPKGVDLAQVGFAQSRVTFSPRGSASETSMVVVANNRQRAQRVDVTAATGLVYLSDIYAYLGTQPMNR